MDQGVSALLGAFIGASAGVASGLGVEAYKRHRDGKAVASAIAGEISASLTMAERRQYVASFTKLADVLETGKDIEMPKYIMDPATAIHLDPVIDKHLDKIGYLPDGLPEQIVRFYSFMRGIRRDIVTLGSGAYEGHPDRKAKVIREDLKLWAETVALGQELVARLHAIAADSFIKRTVRTFRETFGSQ